MFQKELTHKAHSFYMYTEKSIYILSILDTHEELWIELKKEIIKWKEEEEAHERWIMRERFHTSQLQPSVLCIS